MTRVAKAVVKMILINLDAYTIEKAKAYSRIRLSKKSVRKLSGFVLIQQSFYEALTEEFRKLGWLLFELTDTEYGLISLGKTKSWIGLGMSYTDNLITDKGINFDAVDETFDRIHEKFALVSNDEEMIDSALTSQNRLEV